MVTLASVARRARRAFRRTFPTLAMRIRRRLPGQFQDRNWTQPDRYPWLFAFVRDELRGVPRPRLLSFGCSIGDEVFALRHHVPTAAIVGIDVDPRNIDTCRDRARELGADVAFTVASSAVGEPDESYDAVFCLGVLCLGDLTALDMTRADPFLTFEQFERAVADLARCVKPGGLLLLHSTNFRFGDTAAAAGFDVALEVDRPELGFTAIFDRNNRLMSGAQYRPVAFRKRATISPA